MGSSHLIKQTVGNLSSGVSKRVKVILKGTSDNVVKELTESFVLTGGRWISQSASLFLDASKKELVNKTRALKAYIPEAEQLIKNIEIQFADLTKQSSDEAFENLVARKTEVLDNLIRDRAIRGLSQTFGITIKRIEHVIKGEFDNAGNFLGGLHEWAEVKKAFRDGKIRIYLDDLRNSPISSLDDIESSNGVRSFYIDRYNKNGSLLNKPDLKTTFPEDWTYEDVLKSQSIALSNGSPVVGDVLATMGKYEKNGIEYDIRVVKFPDGSINTWYIQ